MKNEELPEAYVELSSKTNSTMFTTCCHVAICQDQLRCPLCRRLIYGHDAESDHKRGVMRWRYAFK